MLANDVRVDRQVACDRIEALGQIGRNPATGGLHRFVYGPELREVRKVLGGWMAENGMRVWEDAVGNLYGRVEGSEPGAPVVTGSHIDTVIEGGRYDGALGVIASLCAVESLLRVRGKPRRAIEVLAICDEEGGRFHTNFWGSRALAGGITAEEAETRTDERGITLADAMRADCYDPSRVGTARRDDIHAWLELHIEQGRILEEGGLDVAIVSSIAGHVLWQVTVSGRDDHAGTTPMDMRQDAMAGAVEMLDAAIAETRTAGAPAVCTAGKFAVSPNIANVVPSEARFTLDIRDGDPERFTALLARIDTRLRTIAEGRRLGLSINEPVRRMPTPLDAGLSRLLIDRAQASGTSFVSMPSMAGHDSEVMAQRWPSAMIFVPSREGRSHTPDEYTSPEQFMPGIQLLADTLGELIY